MRIIQSYIPKSNRNRPGYRMTPKYITVHNTANTSKGANAKAHANYLNGGAGGRSASWHFTVDDTEIYQHLPLNESGWHAGDGNGAGNRQSIGIEICENSDGDFAKAVANAQALISKLMSEYNIPFANVVPHKHWSGKHCPRKLLDNWSDFKAGITGAAPVKTKPTVLKSKSSDNLAIDGKWGPATTRALQRALGTPIDGVISNQLRNAVTGALYGGVTFGKGGSPMVRALQRKVGAGVDGYLGPETVRRLQRYLGTPVDGKIDRPNSKMVFELQKRLNKGTF